MSDDDLQLSDQPFFFQRLGIGADADERAIKRAYARELKLIDIEADPGRFQDLREAYDAALFWVRNPAPRIDDETADPLDEIGRAAAELQLRPLPARAEDRSGSQDAGEAPSASPLDMSADEAAEQVFVEFLARCSELAEADGTQPWERQLQASLADPRLIHIDAREAFEQGIANLLAQGWRPGQHLLFYAATEVFEWERDPRRVHALGAAGYTLHFAIEQCALYGLQSAQERELQRQAIVRLRNPVPPSRSELIDLMPALAVAQARFPTWLSLIADADEISRWHERDKSVPWWARIWRRHDFRIAALPMLFIVLVLVRIIVSSNAPDVEQASTPSVAERYVEEGDKFLDSDDNEKAIDSYGRALREEPQNTSAYSGRALALIYLSQDAEARADLEKLEALAPADPVLFRARGLLAYKEGRYQDAVTAFTRSLEIMPDSAFSLTQRGYGYKALGELDKALRDADRVLEIEPGRRTAHLLRARVFIDRKDMASAKAEAAAVVLTAAKHGAAAYDTAALIYRETGDRAGMLAVMDKAVAAYPSPAQYLGRADAHPSADFAARRADIEAALKLAPDSVPGLIALVRLELQAKRWDAVVDAANRAMRHDSMKDQTNFLHSIRGIGYAKLADMVRAHEDFSAARLAARRPVELNNLCYEMAVQNVALQTALEICDASLEQQPGAAHTRDSKAFTLMRLKRYREALVLYDGLVKESATNVEALYGRGVARHRLGDKTGGRADIDAAIALNAEVVPHFARLELVP